MTHNEGPEENESGDEQRNNNNNNNKTKLSFSRQHCCAKKQSEVNVT